MKYNHGMNKTPVHFSWTQMKTRCYNKNYKEFHHYGGRGITVHKRWLDFRNFYADMGDRPKGTTLDRIENDKDYEPGNCRWATPKEQSNNRRKRRTNAEIDLDAGYITDSHNLVGDETPKRIGDKQ